MKRKGIFSLIAVSFAMVLGAVGALKYGNRESIMEAKAAIPSTIYLQPNSEWPQSNAVLAAYYSNSTWVRGVDSNDDGVLEFSNPSSQSQVIFARLKPSGADGYDSSNGGLNWANKWDQTPNDGWNTIPNDGKNLFTLNSGWGNCGGTWSTFVPRVDVTLQATFTSDVPTYVDIFARGSFNSWTSETSCKMTRVDSQTFTLSLENVPVGSYEYKLVTEFTGAASVTWDHQIDTSNKPLDIAESDDGDTVALGSARTYDFDANMLATSWKLVGNGTAWTGDFVYENGVGMVVNSGNPSEVKVIDVDLTQGDKFKFFDGTTWYGFTNLKSGCPMYSAFQLDGDNNILVKSGFSGTYSFFVDVSSGKQTDRIWATSEPYMALDGWARGFVEAGDLCDSEGEEWSTYAASFAALDPSVQALFASDKVTAKQDGTYIEQAAYRYDNGVIYKHQVAFAATQRPHSSIRTTPVASENNNAITIIAVASALAIVSSGLFLFIRKRKESK